MRSVVLLGLLACHAAPAPVVPTPAVVHVTAEACLVRADVEVAIARVLVEHHAVGLVVDATASGTGDVALRVTRTSGDVGLERSYTLAAHDCASAPQLLALAVDRWLSAFPEWAEPPPPPKPPADRTLAASATAAISGIAPPAGIDGKVGALVDLGGARDRFGATLALRSGLAQPAGTGHFREIAVLAGASWRHRFGAIEARVELRGGALRASGLGFSQDTASWLPWYELAAGGARRWSWGSLGVELAATALHDHAVTKDGLVSQDIPFVRLGITGTFDFVKP